MPWQPRWLVELPDDYVGSVQVRLTSEPFAPYGTAMGLALLVLADVSGAEALARGWWGGLAEDVQNDIVFATTADIIAAVHAPTKAAPALQLAAEARAFLRCVGLTEAVDAALTKPALA